MEPDPDNFKLDPSNLEYILGISPVYDKSKLMMLEWTSSTVNEGLLCGMWVPGRDPGVKFWYGLEAPGHDTSRYP